MKKKKKNKSFFTISETVTSYQEEFLRNSLMKTNKTYTVVELSEKESYYGTKYVTIVHSKNLKFSAKEWRMVWELSKKSKFVDRFWNSRKNHLWEHRYEATPEELKVWMVEWTLREGKEEDADS